MGVEVLIGIDAGHTVCKAGAFTVEGIEIAVESERIGVDRPRPGWAERDMESLWIVTAGVLRRLVERLGDARILGVGVCGHGDGAYLLDETLRPVRPGILAIDSRAQHQAEALRTGEGAARAIERNGQIPFAPSPPALWRWFEEFEPETVQRTRWYLHCKDLVRLRLTDVPGTDPTDAGAGVFNPESLTWSEEIAECYGISTLLPKLPPIDESSSVVGKVTPEASAVTGIPVGTLVVAGAHDVDAAALGMGAAGVGATSVVMGTFNINQVVADRVYRDPRWQARPFLAADRRLHMSTSANGASVLDWVASIGASELSMKARFALATEAMASPFADDAPIFVPHLTGAPFAGPSGGSFLGLKSWHSREDLLRSALEGVTATHRRHLDALQSQMELSSVVRATGGGVRMAAWTQLLADMLGRTVEVSDSREAGARGVALLAGLGTGQFDNLDHAGASATGVAHTFEPDELRSTALARRYERFLEATSITERWNRESK